MQVKRDMAARARCAGGIMAAGVLALVLALAGTKVAGEGDSPESATGLMPAYETDAIGQWDTPRSGNAGYEAAAALASAPRDPAVRSVASAVLAGDEETLLARLGCKVLEPAQVVQAEAAGILPRGFHTEVLALAAYDRVMVDPAASVVGFACKGAAESVFADLALQLAASGWRREESGLGVGGSFTKESGVLRWLFIMCYQMEGETAVVLQYR